YVFLIFTTCALFLLAGALVFQQPLLPVPMEEVLIFLGLAVISTMFGHTLFSWSLRYFTASFVSLAYLGEPIGATILAALLLAELPTVNWMIGGVLVLIGIVLTARTEIAARNGRRQGR
ncbi:MAG: EamA family transporter, partial [Methanomassiliicoccales archaeon]